MADLERRPEGHSRQKQDFLGKLKDNLRQFFTAEGPYDPSRREFLGKVAAGLAVTEAARRGILPIFSEEIMSEKDERLIFGLLEGKAEAVVEALQTRLKVSGESVQPFKKGDNKWNFSLVAKLPYLPNGLLSEEAVDNFYKGTRELPDLVRISLKGLNLNNRQKDGLFDLLGGKRQGEDKIRHDKEELALAFAAGATAGAGALKIAEGLNKTIHMEDGASKDLITGAGLEALGVGTLATARVTDEEFYNSLSTEDQKKLSILALALFPPNWVAGCTSQLPEKPDIKIPLPTPNIGITRIAPEGTPVVPHSEKTPSPNPPEDILAYPVNASGFLWNYASSNNNPEDIQELQPYLNTVTELEDIYRRAAKNSGLDPSKVKFVGSVGPESWVVAMKYEGKYYVMQKNGLNIAPITPYGFQEEFRQDPSQFKVIELNLLPGYTQENIVMVPDASTFHVIATDDREYFLDLANDTWRDKDGNEVESVTVIPTERVKNIEAASWAEDEKGNFDPSKMFKLVGSINHVNRRYVDLEYNRMKIALATSEDITQLQDLDQFKREQAEKINSLSALKNILDEVVPRGNPQLYTAVIENNEVTQLIFENGSVFKRHHVDSEGNVTAFTKEEEPQLLPELRINGPYIERADTGERIQFKGIGLYDDQKPTPSLSLMKDILFGVEKQGIFVNIVRLSFDTLDYNIDEIINAVKYFETKGIYVIIDPHFIGRGSKNEAPELPDESVSEALLNLAKKLKDKNNVLWEFWNEFYPGGAFPTKSDWDKPISIMKNEATGIQAVYSDTGKEPIFIASGLVWGRDLRNFPEDLPFKFIIDVHDYPWYVNSNGAFDDTVPEEIYNKREWWTPWIGIFPILLGEFGDLFGQDKYPQRDIEWSNQSLQYVKDNPYKIHYTLWGWTRAVDFWHQPVYANRIVLPEQKENPNQTDFRK